MADDVRSAPRETRRGERLARFYDDELHKSARKYLASEMLRTTPQKGDYEIV
jgi:hypothetical protein